MAARITTLPESGAESPKSDHSQTRFSTPVSDLDDHRNQPSMRPRGDTVTSRHSIAIPPHASGDSPHHAGLLQVNQGLRELRSASGGSEHAVIDDDASNHGQHITEHQGSSSPAVARNGTLRRSRNPQNRSRDSSPSSRSTSPANSVNAFAEGRRRERRNTVESRASELDLGPQRTLSAGSRQRRSSVNNDSVRNPTIQDDRASVRAAEEDVCFPTVDQPSKTSKIDFEELDEYVANQQATRLPQGQAFRQKLSFSCGSEKPNRFLDHQPHAIPMIRTQSASSIKPSEDCAIDDSDTVLNEKLGDVDQIQDRRPSGTEPMRYSFFSTEMQQTIHAADFVDLLAPGENFRDLFDFPEDSGVWWLDISNPTEDEMEVFQKAFGIHRLTTEDIMTQEAREKVELFKQYYFVCFRSFFQIDEKHEDYMEPVNVYMVVFREGIITVTYEQSPHAANVRKRIGRLRDFMSLTADWICYAMIDNIVDTFGPPIHRIEIEADTIEDQVFVARTDDFASLLRQIGVCRKKVMSLMRLLGGKADVIKGFAKRCNEQYSVTPRGEIGLYLGDIQDHVVTMMSNLGHFEKMLSRSHSNYLAQLSVDHIAQGSRANEVLSKITLLASILVPLNLICGLFGMNVNVPGKNVDGLGWFFGILGVIAVFVVMSLALARKMKFI